MSENTTVIPMHITHPVYGDLVTAHRLVRGGRWVFRGTIVPLDDVFADLQAGMTLEEVWEKNGTLDWSDLKAVVGRSAGARTTTSGHPTKNLRRAS